MTVEEFFDNFLISEVNLNKLCEGECDGSIPNCDICMVTSTYKKLVDKLKNELKIQPTDDEENKPSYFLTGSYRRHTMIRPPKDVDLFLVLDSGEYKDSELDNLITPKALIGRLKEALKKIFENDDEITVEEQRHSVTVIYNDSFSIDVIPAFETDNGSAYKIPDIEDGENGYYITSNPKIHYKYINDINDSTITNGKKRFKKTARLLKFIKRQNFNEDPKKIRSFHFELLAAKILGSNKINSYSEAINNFLSKAAGFFNKASIIDPANSENKIDDYIDDYTEETKSAIKDELNSLAEISQTARDYESSGDDDNAILQWKKIFYVEDRGDKSSKGFSTGPTIITSPSKPWAIL